MRLHALSRYLLQKAAVEAKLHALKHGWLDKARELGERWRIWSVWRVTK